MSTDNRLFSAYERVSSNKASDRQSGLTDLRQLLLNKQNSNPLNDKGFHKMYEVLFRCALLDKSGYLKGGKSQKAFATRLSTCAAVLRIAVDAGLSVIKAKTAKALFNHILDTLPTSGGTLCEPLSLDYIRSLASCLGYATHAEHLLPDEWTKITIFCIKHLRMQAGLPDEEEPPAGGSQAPRNEAGRVLLRNDSSNSRMSASQLAPRLSHESEELVVCLRNLLATSNAPILEVIDPACRMLLGFLDLQSTFSRAQQSAFSSLNSILATITTNSIEWVAKISDAIVPLVTRLWDTKAPGLKDELIISLVYCLPHIKQRLEDKVDPRLRDNLDKLLDTLCSEYRDRPERDVLQLDDISFQSSNEESLGALSVKSMYLGQSQEFRMEQGWATLNTIAQLIDILDGSDISKAPRRSRRHSRNPSGDEPPRKRQQTSHTQFGALLRTIRSSREAISHRLLALQVVPFLCELGGVDEEYFGSIIQDLYEACLDGAPTIVSWALIAIASCAYLQQAKDPKHALSWQNIWKFCERSVANTATCRASCNVMRIILHRNIIPYADVSTNIDMMLRSVDLNGPASLTDSSLGFLRLIVQKRNTVAQSLGFYPGDSLFQWFASKWNPVENLERTGGTFYINTRTHNPPTLELVNFILDCVKAEPISVQSSKHIICGSVGQAYIRNRENWELEKILLDIPDNSDNFPEDEPPKMSRDKRNVGFPGLEQQILEFLTRQTTIMHEKWQLIMSGNMQHMTESMIRNFVSFILLATIIASKLTKAGDERGTAVRTKLEATMFGDLRMYMESSLCQQKQIDGILWALAEFLPNPSEIVTPSTSRVPLPQATQVLLSEIFEGLNEKELQVDAPNTVPDDDPMDLDDGFENSRTTQQAGGELIRETLKARCSEEGARACTMASLALFTMSSKDHDPTVFSDEFAEYLMDAHRRRFIMMRPIVVDFLTAANDILSDTIAGQFSIHLAKALLEGHEVERCESSIGFCVDAANAIAPRWIKNRADGDLASYSRAIYVHATRLGIEKKITSPGVRMSINGLLEHVMRLNPNYGQSDQKKPLDLFLGNLGDPDVRVAYCVAQRLPTLLSLYSSSWHGKMMDEVERALPQARDWTEGLALRVYALSQLALMNSSTITRIIYRIFETGQLKNGERYACRALLLVAKAFQLPDQRMLFKHFSANLIHTWLEHHELQNFPFRTFGFRSLEELFEYVPGDLVAQLLSLKKDDVVEEVAKSLGLTFNQLLTDHFPKIAAYAFVWHVNHPVQAGSTSEEALQTVEARMRERLGDKDYGTLLATHYRVIVATLFDLMLEDSTSDRLFMKELDLADASHVMSEIKEQGFSPDKLPPPLHPWYKIKVILLAIDHLCTKLNCRRDQLWRPAMLTFVIRHLFDSIHPARGPIHACGVIRKIRFLICLAGPAVKKGYLLEMLVHGLKPYITDTYCAADTVGVLKYLLLHGKAHLQRKPEFAIGVFLSLVASLRDLTNTNRLADTQDPLSTQSAVSFATDFRQWFAEHLMRFKFPDPPTKQSSTFHAIVRSALLFKDSGSARKDREESELLQLLLSDAQSKHKLLDDTSRRLAFNLYCSNFERPATFTEDIFGTDELSVQSAKNLLAISKKFDVGNGFLLWAARVLGRSYAGTGHLDSWMQEIEFNHPSEDEIPGSLGTDAVPKVAIMRRLLSLLRSNNKVEVSHAERAIESAIHTESGDTKNNHRYELVLEQEDIIAFKWSDLPELVVPYDTGLETVNDLPLAHETPAEKWIQEFAILMCIKMAEAFLYPLPPLLGSVPGLAQELLPYIVHILLYYEQSGVEIDLTLCDVFNKLFKECSEATVPHCSILIDCVLYLRTQGLPEEINNTGRRGAQTSNPLKRDKWLDISWLDASRAAVKCKKYRCALLFVEIYNAHNDGKTIIEPSLLLDIFKNIDDPDSYYGVNQASNLKSVLDKFDYEGDGWKSLSFRGANLESYIRLGSSAEEEKLGVVDSLNTLGMNGLSHAFLSDGSVTVTEEASEKMFRSAWKLEQWDLPCPETYTTPAATIYRALQTVNTTMDTKGVATHTDPTFLQVMKEVVDGSQTVLGVGMRSLAMLTEMEEILLSSDVGRMEEVEGILQRRTKWMHTGRYSDVEEIMAMRQATFGSLAKREHLRNATGVDLRAARLFEAKALVDCCKMARSHGVLQHSLSAATQLSKVVGPCREAGVDIGAVACLQAAKVLWDDGQGSEGISMLQVLSRAKGISSQPVPVSLPKVLAQLGSWISEARLEKPDVIMVNYLERAIEELQGKLTGSDAGRVFHEFAAFCDRQIENPVNKEEFERVTKLKNEKEAEVYELEKMMESTRTSTGRVKQSVLSHHTKAKAWLILDEQEYTRLKKIREAFLEKSILNYLKCLAACDDYDSDAVRFCALWLAHLENDRVNKAAALLQRVPSRKFVPLMNQLSSRLLETNDKFQVLLKALILRICQEHPHHGVYHILALMRAHPSKEPTAVLRLRAATSVADSLKGTTRAHRMFINIEHATNLYNKLAVAKVEKRKDGKSIHIRECFASLGSRAPRLERDLPKLGIPPPTMHIDVRHDGDYTMLPVLEKFDPECTLASGISVPKIVKCQASNGRVFKMLVKSGNDDLRQDSIMEQVFEQVSHLLQKSRITRQRNLKIRTYRVIPLTTTSGIIEFVPNTIPLQEYLQPAHKLYYPRDLQSTQCRNIISEAQNKDRETRVTQYQRACRQFHPVLHFFFMHKFNGPDEWYTSRLAYTRSTAAISILGHVLGLGDRHGHNILLDEKTGEVVHIDLGVAFEQGRILPVPEVVPFRLTRDIVAGMGITKTEGVFRRCCEFTLEVLRNESYNITTILDVLRYDPLYNWSLSPLKLKRMQENPYEASGTAGKLPVAGKRKDEDADAERALEVVLKKLSKTLSVGATVNELIQQAGDERNLAVLYAGWAAWC